MPLNRVRTSLQSLQERVLFSLFFVMFLYTNSHPFSYEHTQCRPTSVLFQDHSEVGREQCTGIWNSKDKDVESDRTGQTKDAWYVVNFFFKDLVTPPFAQKRLRAWCFTCWIQRRCFPMRQRGRHSGYGCCSSCSRWNIWWWQRTCSKINKRAFNGL